jgi:hypothetical protein
METPLGVTKRINLQASIELENDFRRIRDINEDAPLLDNTGIYREGGIHNLFEYTANETLSSFIFHTFNGERISLTNSSTGTVVGIVDKNNNASIVVSGKPVFIPKRYNLSKTLAIPNLIDATVQSNGDLWVLFLNESQQLIKRKYNSTTLTIIGSDITVSTTYSAENKYRLGRTMVNGVREPGVFFMDPQFNIVMVGGGGVVQMGKFVNDFVAYQETGTGTGVHVCGLGGLIPGGNYAYRNTAFPGGGATANLKANYIIPISATEVSRTWDIPTGETLAIGTSSFSSDGTNINPGFGGATQGFSGPGFTFIQYASESFFYQQGTSGTTNLTPGRSYNAPPPPVVRPTHNDVLSVENNLYIHTVGGKLSQASFIRAGLVTEVGELYPLMIPTCWIDYSGAPNFNHSKASLCYETASGEYILVSGQNGYESIREVASGIVKIGPFFIDVQGKRAYYIDEGYAGGTGEGIQNWAAPVPLRRYNAKFEESFCGSVDFGEIITNIPETPLRVIASTLYPINAPNIGFNLVTPFNIKVYLNGVFSFSIPRQNYSLVDTIYIPNTRLPIPAGETVNGFSVSIESGSALVSNQYSGYDIQNILAEKYSIFLLLGQYYGFDGDSIFFIPTANNIVNGVPQRLTQAVGLRFLASSPELAWFYSDFDNGIFVFDGGRSLKKVLKMTRYGTLLNSIYSIEDDSLYILFSDGFIVMRSGQFSRLPYKSWTRAFVTQTTTIFATTNVQWFAWLPKSGMINNQTVFPGTFSTTLVSLQLNTPMYGYFDNTWMKITKAVVLFRKNDGTNIQRLRVLNRYNRQDGSINTDNLAEYQTPVIPQNTYTERVEFYPKTDAVASSSLEITLENIVGGNPGGSSRLLIESITIYYQPIGPMNTNTNQKMFAT